MILTSEQLSDYLHELLCIQYFVEHCEKPEISTEVVEVPEEVIYCDASANDIDYLLDQLCSYNHDLIRHIPGIAADEKVTLERKCKYRVSRDVFKQKLLKPGKSSGSSSFGKVDKWIQFPGEAAEHRLQSKKRTVITVSSQFGMADSQITIRTVITANSMRNYAAPSFQDLLGSIGV